MVVMELLNLLVSIRITVPGSDGGDGTPEPLGEYQDYCIFV
jgi:hypothetical protein